MASTSSASGGGNAASRIQQLQKQLKDATNELKQVANGDGDAASKKQQTELLQMRIQMLQSQIEALQNQQTQQAQKLQSSAKAVEASTVQSPAQSSGLGSLLDEYA